MVEEFTQKSNLNIKIESEDLDLKPTITLPEDNLAIKDEEAWDIEIPKEEPHFNLEEKCSDVNMQKIAANHTLSKAKPPAAGTLAPPRQKRMKEVNGAWNKKRRKPKRRKRRTESDEKMNNSASMGIEPGGHAKDVWKWRLITPCRAKKAVSVIKARKPRVKFLGSSMILLPDQFNMVEPNDIPRGGSKRPVNTPTHVERN